MGSAHDVTQLLVAWSEGNQAAHEELMEIVYAELKRLAKSYLRREYANHSFAATALVHEAYVKLVDQRNVRWQSRSHFFGVAAQAMRRILVDRVRATQAAKRGGVGAGQVPYSYLQALQGAPDVDVLALDEALSRLEGREPRWSRLIELRFFAGLSVEETAAALELSPATVKRDWRLARAWLYREIKTGGNTGSRHNERS
jgi:RNA polymerase sigma factor (TIGR02999 family)